MVVRRRSLRIALGLIVALGIAATRSEKLFVEILAQLAPEVVIVTAHGGGTPFDPRRVPQSGGMAGRLLAGIGAKSPALQNEKMGPAGAGPGIGVIG
jgi:hypothetical protein